jgi:hypothetical protein
MQTCLILFIFADFLRYVSVFHFNRLTEKNVFRLKILKVGPILEE